MAPLPVTAANLDSVIAGEREWSDRRSFGGRVPVERGDEIDDQFLREIPPWVLRFVCWSGRMLVAPLVTGIGVGSFKRVLPVRSNAITL
jgi:hypothetical protein